MQMQFSRDELRSIGTVWQSSDLDEQERLLQFTSYETDLDATQEECVGENQVQKGALHRKSLSTGQMVHSNADITQLFNQLVMNLSPRKLNNSTSCADNSEEIREHMVEDGTEDILSEYSSQLSSSSQISGSSGSFSPDGEGSLPINQLQEFANSLDRITTTLQLHPSNINSPSPPNEEPQQIVISPTRKPSFDVNTLRLNLSRLDSSASVGSSLDITVDQILAMSVGRALWASSTPTPRKTARSPSPSPSPTHSPSLEQNFNRRSYQWVQALPGEDCNKDALVGEASSQIAELTRRQVSLNVEKELLEEEMQYWQERVKSLEDRLVSAEEMAAEKSEMLEQLQQQLQQMMALRFNGQQHEHLVNREDSSTQFEHHHVNLLSTNSDLSMSYQSGGSSSLLKVGQMGEDVVNRVYPPLQNKAFEQLLHDKKSLVQPDNQKDQILHHSQQQIEDQSHNQQWQPPAQSVPVSGYVLGMLWSGENSISSINVQGFTSKMFSIIKEVLFSEKFSAFWDWFLMVVFPLLGFAGLSICITMLFAGVTFAWRRANTDGKFKWFNSA